MHISSFKIYALSLKRISKRIEEMLEVCSAQASHVGACTMCNSIYTQIKHELIANYTVLLFLPSFFYGRKLNRYKKAISSPIALFFNFFFQFNPFSFFFTKLKCDYLILRTVSHFSIINQNQH